MDSLDMGGYGQFTECLKKGLGLTINAKYLKKKPYMTEGVRQIPTQCKNQYLLFVQIPNSDI